MLEAGIILVDVAEWEPHYRRPRENWMNCVQDAMSKCGLLTEDDEDRQT